MPLIPAPRKVDVKADSVSPIENALISILFPQGDEPDIPLNPVAGIAKGAFFRKLRQSLREQSIEQRVRGVMTAREADELYATGLKSLEKLKDLPKSVFKKVYSVSGSTKRVGERAKSQERDVLSKLRWLSQSGADQPSKLKVASQYDVAKETADFLGDEKNFGYLLGTKGTRALTGVNRVKGRSLLGVGNNPEHNFGETAAHELGHVESLSNVYSTGKALSEELPQLADPSMLRGATKSTGVNVHDPEELTAELFSYVATDNKMMLDKLSKEGFDKQINFVKNLHRSLLQKGKKLTQRTGVPGDVE